MSDRPLTILQLTHQGGGSGSTTIIADLSRQLARRGHRVLVGCRPDTKLAHLARDAGLELVPLDFRRLGPLARALEEVTDREGVDVVNSNATRDRRALTWLRWTRRLGRPFVVTRHTMPLTSPAELVAVGLSADRTIAVSHAVARALRRRLHPAARLRVVTNGIDLARVDARLSEADLTAARAALGDLAGRPVVLILARRKDQDVLLRSLVTLERPVVVACVGVEPDAELRAAEQIVPARHRVGAVAGARPGRYGVRRADRAARSRARPGGVHAGAFGRADRGGVPGSARAAAIARRGTPAGALTGTLLLALNFPPFGGGIARMMGEVALRYPPRSLTISTGTWPGWEAGDSRFPQAIDRVAIGAKRLRTLNGLGLWTWRAASLARRTRPGFVWCDEVKPAGYAATWLHARGGPPFGVIAHGADFLLLDAKIRRSVFKRWTARHILARCSVVVANSRWTADLARSVLEFLGCGALAADVRVVPLGTTPSRFRPGLDPAPVRRQHRLEGGPWLLTVARLDYHKGVDTVIRALPAIRAVFPTVRYAVAGIGSRHDALERLVAELGLGDAVCLLGFVSDDELPALYNAADLFVLASRRYDLLVEGFGISIVEASASGLPVIGSRSGGMPEAIRDGETGFLVEPDDPAALAATAIRLLGDEGLRRRMGAAGRAAVESYYNWDRVAADLIGIDREFRRS